MTAAKIIAAALCGRPSGGGWWSCRCPVHDDHTPSLSLRDGDRSLITHCHAGCDARDVLAELRRLGLLAGRSDGALPMPTNARGADRNDPARRSALARRIWEACRDARGSPVMRYLAGRHLIMHPLPMLRYAPACKHPSGIYLPAMVAKVVNADGELIAVHRTFLRADGSGKANIKPDKAALAPIRGGAVRLTPPAERLMIGEGIETCLSVMQATGEAVWAALSTSGVMSLVLPPIVRKITIIADNDANGAGERAARVAAQRWVSEGRRVWITMPPEVDSDFNDVLVGRSHAAVTGPLNVAA
jgi:phage/plasmid primase-like uncharacterized protein